VWTFPYTVMRALTDAEFACKRPFTQIRRVVKTHMISCDDDHYPFLTLPMPEHLRITEIDQFLFHENRISLVFIPRLPFVAAISYALTLSWLIGCWTSIRVSKYRN